MILKDQEAPMTTSKLKRKSFVTMSENSLPNDAHTRDQMYHMDEVNAKAMESEFAFESPEYIGEIDKE
jgi:hypothetical protein